MGRRDRSLKVTCPRARRAWAPAASGLHALRAMKSKWQKPTYVEIRMNAEVGSYQNEFEERQQTPPPRSTGKR